MAINLITQPGATTPIGNDDYTQQNLLINGALAQGDEVLTSWADTITEPSIAQGTYFYHSGNLYQVDSADESISGTISSGVNYIVLSVSGTTLTASYTPSLTGYVFNPAYNGLYNGTDLVIKAVTYLIGASNIRGTSINKTMDGMFMLSDGSFVSSAGQFNLGDKDIVTSGDVGCGDGSFSGDISCADLTADSVTSGTSPLKWKTFTGTTNSSSVASFSHGLTASSVYGFSALVKNTNGIYYPDATNISSSYQVRAQMSSSAVTLTCFVGSSSGSFASQSYKATIFYV